MLLANKISGDFGRREQARHRPGDGKLFAEHGARVAILDLDKRAAAGSRRQHRQGPHRRSSATSPISRAARHAAETVLGAFGQPDILVNNAGISQPLKLMEIKPENWDAVLDVNLRGVLYLSQAFIPHMRERKQGSIACMSSVSAQRGGGIFGGPHYSAAKAGVLGLAKAMARELGPDSIRVNCVTPGLIQTDITGGKLTDELRTEIRKGIPLNRLGDAEDVARAYLFLASELSSYITGAVIDVNGGMLIH